MKKKIKALVALCLLIMTISCSNSEANEKATLPETNPQEENKQEQVLLDYGEEFIPPHFQVEKFSLQVNDNSLYFEVDYVYDQQLFTFLQNHQPTYYYAIQYPPEVKELLSKKQSAWVEGPVISDDVTKRNYELTIEEEISDLSAKQITSFENQLEGYKLIVFNSEKYPIHIINDLYHYQYFELK
ncbi:hypothetical protein [Pontibacillus litoralis]|uniref:Lipoprotein n=1 Tax=Pontibacillus litoralis JSM 072002 TaxID=1385512 RepID=A0A0A5HLY2_9BACI|nr:hypothetical protein [Pontibacillus litoralis]KGX84637.1 hypothetical protein N784_12215 [Pontibacillus litoralis JSM 072002]